MLATLVRGFPVEVTDFGIVPDDRGALVAAFDRARAYDIVVTTGGASVGDHDLVRPCLIDAGATLDFWKVAMRPGKPLMAGSLGGAVVLGLPGNPVSAFVTATLFLLPLVRHLSGAFLPLPPTMSAELATAMPGVAARTDFVRAAWTGSCIAPLPSSDSGALGPLAASTALIVRPANAPAIEAGARVEVISLT
jgi:molybdopterin molybdotransferase